MLQCCVHLRLIDKRDKVNKVEFKKLRIVFPVLEVLLPAGRNKLKNRRTV